MISITVGKRTWSLQRPARIAVVGVLALAAVSAIMADDCGGNSAESKTQQSTNNQQAIYNKNQPLPSYQYSAERAEMIALYNARNSGNQNTWSVWISNSGQPLGMCASKGYPLPYGTELTNPQQAVNTGSSSAATSIGQADPNGLYPAPNAMGTWVMCLDPDGSLHPFYSEPLVMTYTHPVAIQNGKVVDVGKSEPSSAINTHR